MQCCDSHSSGSPCYVRSGAGDAQKHSVAAQRPSRKGPGRGSSHKRANADHDRLCVQDAGGGRKHKYARGREVHTEDPVPWVEGPLRTRCAEPQAHVEPRSRAV